MNYLINYFKVSGVYKFIDQLPGFEIESFYKYQFPSGGGRELIILQVQLKLKWYL